MIIDDKETFNERNDIQYWLAIGASVFVLILTFRSILYSIALPIPHYFNLDIYAAFWFLQILLGLVTFACAWLFTNHIWRRIDRGTFAPKRFAILLLVMAVFFMIIGSYLGILVNDHMQEIQAEITYPTGYFAFVSIYSPIFWNLEVLMVILILLRRRS